MNTPKANKIEEGRYHVLVQELVGNYKGKFTIYLKSQVNPTQSDYCDHPIYVYKTLAGAKKSLVNLERF